MGRGVYSEVGKGLGKRISRLERSVHAGLVEVGSLIRCAVPDMTSSIEGDSLVLLIDHDNVPFEEVGLRTIIETWLNAALPDLPTGPILTLDVRAYGGWWLEENASDARYKAAEFYQTALPSLMVLEHRYLRVRFTFADYLISNPAGTRITNTVVSRASPQNISLHQSALSCTEAGCELSAMRRWVRRRKACIRPGCPHPFQSQFFRREQKQVDVHIATDLLAVAMGSHPARHVGVVSDDADLLPSVIYAAGSVKDKRGALTLIRIETRTAYADSALKKLGVRIVCCSD